MDRRRKEQSIKRRKNPYFWPVFVTVVCMILTAGTGVAVFRFYFNKSGETVEDEVYDRYYVMITEDQKSSFWQSVYHGAYQNGLKNHVYVDWFGENLPEEYDREDLMRIAIASGVDGIIVSADEGEEITSLIDEAVAEGIPVVTLYSDSTKSGRCSFVGVGSYNLGREYGRMALCILGNILGNRNILFTILEGDMSNELEEKSAETVKIAVLVNAYASDVDQNILYSGIQETLENDKSTDAEIDIFPVSIDDTNAFAVEESIRDIFMEQEVPDIIICLDELSTTCVYQAVVDYNMVGEVNILGYFLSDTIVNAIDRNVIYATVAIDTEQMGSYCIDALQEYYELGYTSQYFTADITVVKHDDIELYLHREEMMDE